MIFPQDLLVDSRLVVIPVYESDGDYLHKVLIAGIVLRQQYQMEIPVVAVRGLLVEARARSHIDLASDHRLYPGGDAFLVEIDRTIHNAVIRDRSGIHSQLLNPGDIFLYLI